MATYDQDGYQWPDFDLYGRPQYSGPYGGPSAPQSGAGASNASPGTPSVSISLNSDGTVSGIPVTWLMIGLGLFLMLLVRR